MTIGCLSYTFQHSLCMDPGELSCFPESRISSEPSTHLIFEDGDQPIIPGEGNTERLHYVSYVQRYLRVNVLFLGEQPPGGGLCYLYVRIHTYWGYGSCLIMGNISCFHVQLKYAVILGGLQCLLTNCQPFSFLFWREEESTVPQVAFPFSFVDRNLKLGIEQDVTSSGLKE